MSVGLEAIEMGNLHREVVPSGALASLKVRRSTIEASLISASPDARAIGAVLASLGGMQARTLADPDEARAVLMQAIEDLSDVPLWALERAAKAYRKGDVGDGKWRPTPGELCIEARRQMAPVKGELYRLRKLLDHRDLERPKPVYLPIEQGMAIYESIKAMGASKSPDSREATA